MNNDLKWMLSSDQQIPYQDDRALDLWWQVMKWFKPDVVDYLGDTSDQFCFGRYEEGTTKEFLKTLPTETKTEDILKYVQYQEKDTADFYAKTRKMRPNAEIFSALGNHDIRVFNYADKNLPEILTSARSCRVATRSASSTSRSRPRFEARPISCRVPATRTHPAAWISRSASTCR